MTDFKAKYINPFTDYGFKRLFGEEPNKDLLLDFLNQVLRDVEGEIVDLSYLPAEKLPQDYDSRRAIFDLYCTNEKGEKFIVELQKAKQKFFKDRTVYYSTFPIQEQAVKGQDWNFELRNVYLIAILDFVFDQDQAQAEKFRHDVKLTDLETHKVFYDKLTFVYFEMPKFNKKEQELKTKYDKWLFVLKNLNKLDRIPVELKEGIFMKLFDTAEVAKLDPEEFTAYQASLNAYRDMKNSIDTALEEGEMKGIIKGKIEVAKNLLKNGISIDIISASTGLSKEDIESLRKESND
ncbi:MAG: Rpn family recombination-promoting nuclease/putative transposase [Bacteroidales bacterium]|nr:Rpn family recombination-promoting nuclease/putative transposase [Bacteroidales bacterium]